MSTSCPVLEKALTANTAGGAFAAKAATTTKPSGAGVFDLLNIYKTTGRTGMAKFIQLLPYGTAANDSTFDMQLWGWYRTNESTIKWVSVLLVELNVVAGDIAQGETNTFMADTLAIAKGDADASKISPANNYGASILTHLRGCELIEFEFNVGTATDANCYWGLVDQS